MAKWVAAAIAILQLIGELFSAKAVSDAKAEGKAEAVREGADEARRSIEKARQIEADVAKRHASDPTDGAFRDTHFRD